MRYLRFSIYRSCGISWLLETLFMEHSKSVNMTQKSQNFEFESHSFLENQGFLPTEQAGTNICWMIHQDVNFKICHSLFDWKENILYKQHIVQCPNGQIFVEVHVQRTSDVKTEWLLDKRLSVETMIMMMMMMMIRRSRSNDRQGSDCSRS